MISSHFSYDPNSSLYTSLGLLGECSEFAQNENYSNSLFFEDGELGDFFDSESPAVVQSLTPFMQEDSCSSTEHTFSSSTVASPGNLEVDSTVLQRQKELSIRLNIMILNQQQTTANESSNPLENIVSRRTKRTQTTREPEQIESLATCKKAKKKEDRSVKLYRLETIDFVWTRALDLELLNLVMNSSSYRMKGEISESRWLTISKKIKTSVRACKARFLKLKGKEQKWTTVDTKNLADFISTHNLSLNARSIVSSFSKN